MTARDLKTLLNSIPESELDLDVIVHDENCEYKGDDVSAEVSQTDLGNSYNPDAWDGEWVEIVSPEQFAVDEPDEKFHLWIKKGQIIITLCPQ